jgi:hypothetical protein
MTALAICLAAFQFYVVYCVYKTAFAHRTVSEDATDG